MAAVRKPKLVDFRMTRVRIPIVGVMELIMNRWTKEAIEAVEAAQRGEVVERGPRDPEAEYKNSIYRDDNGEAIIPAVNVKACLTDAARSFSGINMTDIRQMVRVNGPSLVEGGHHMRSDPVRLQGKGWTIAYRASFLEWRAVLDFSFVGAVLSENVALNLVRAAGMVGFCAWRPGASNSGWAGTFEVDVGRINEQSIQAE